jgi:hypothetical protein
VNELTKKESLGKEEYLSWSAYHATMQPPPNYQVSRNALLPLFHEDSKSVAMVKHGMHIVKQATNVLNPGQVPVFTVDQPLFALAKQIQWNWPNSIYGEKNYVVMFGGLHIELVGLKLLGDWLTGSGWTSVLAEANVASPGVADSFLKASHIARTRHAHQITAAALSILLTKAYERYKQDLLEENEAPLEKDEWCEQRMSNCPQFQFWHMTP